MRFWCLILAFASLFIFINGTNPGCLLGKDEGRGNYDITRAYFDKGNKKCKDFIYKGQGGNGNRFNSLHECRTQCICGLPLNQGTNGGAGPSQRFYHKNGQCLKMTYKGSGGNPNNFPTLEECQKTCLTIDEICNLQYDHSTTADHRNCEHGGCVSRFYFNKDALQCTTVHFFQSRGANWNGNSFRSREECEKTCACRFKRGSVQKVNKEGPGITYYFDAAAQKCQLGKGVGVGVDNSFNSIVHCNDMCICSQPVDSGLGSTPVDKFFFNPITKKCELFTYLGQGGNANRFNSKKDCLFTCACGQEKNEGTGSNPIVRYFYAKFLLRCVPFTYNGQGGNGNNFGSLNECATSCGVCDADIDISPKAHFTHYYYDKDNKFCKPYNHREMGYTANNFRSKIECDGSCTCGLPKNIGYGRKRLTRYYFNKQKGRCEILSYRGNGGNGNNFKSLDDCKQACVCGLEKNVGSGSQYVKRYYFNPVTEKCEVFFYKGQEGNQNNFRSLDACYKVCKCNLPKSDGSYGPSDQLYFYNSNLKACEKLTNGYEGGNANRFKTKQECQNTCV